MKTDILSIMAVSYKNISRLMPILLAVCIFSLTACAKNFPPARYENPDAKVNLVIAGISSDFRDMIQEKIIADYKAKGNIEVMGLDQLNTVDCKNYDAIIVMDQCKAWSWFNLSLNSFLKNSKHCDNIIVFMTAGDPEWNFRYEGLDAVTSASAVGSEAEIYATLSAKIEELLSARKE